MTVYYHGTEARHLYSIMTEGFRLGEVRHGRVNGNGLYVATKPETVTYYAPRSYISDKSYAVKCRLQEGTRILWKDPDYCRKTIRYLKREFSKHIVGFDFWKYIPKNKHLTPMELSALLSHLDDMRFISWSRNFSYGKRERLEDKRYKNLSRLGKIIRNYGYDALGDRTGRHWDADEIMVFNPSRVIPVSAHALNVDWDEDYEPLNVHFSKPFSLDELKSLSQQDQQDWDDYLKQYDKEMEEEGEKS